MRMKQHRKQVTSRQGRYSYAMWMKLKASETHINIWQSIFTVTRGKNGLPTQPLSSPRHKISKRFRKCRGTTSFAPLEPWYNPDCTTHTSAANQHARLSAMNAHWILQDGALDFCFRGPVTSRACALLFFSRCRPTATHRKILPILWKTLINQLI